MRSGITIVLTLSLGIITSWAGAQQDERTMSREQRIAAHQERIKEIIRANKVIQMNSGEFRSDPTTSSARPQVHDPESYEITNVKVLKEIKATDAQIAKLRQNNQQLWDLRIHDEHATAPEVSAKVKPLLIEQMGILTPEQQSAYLETRLRHMEQIRARFQNPPVPPQNKP
jgi:hypothetical protein